ncbi:hypothetical protein QBC36DRAFT_307204 [Triangularia setosa]|uniref:Uncharacterized protein n=1 Tax=Triangularia setosa TaxID=2587417 RepID=A0AAN6WI69_9PEZI|nr:hypothetical protein QBC36DRAFT_307204 [Podospora setosa]
MPKLSGDRLYEHLHDLYKLRLGCYSERQANPVLELARLGHQPDGGLASDVFPKAEIRAWASQKEIAPRKALLGALYRPIVGPYEIQVLEIKPGIDDNSIYCCLYHYSLEFKEPHWEETRK